MPFGTRLVIIASATRRHRVDCGSGWHDLLRRTTTWNLSRLDFLRIQLAAEAHNEVESVRTHPEASA